MSSTATRILRVCIFEARWQNLGDFILMHTEAPNGIVSIHYIFTRTTLGGLSETALEVFRSSMGVGSDSLLQMNELQFTLQGQGYSLLTMTNVQMQHLNHSSLRS